MHFMLTKNCVNITSSSRPRVICELRIGERIIRELGCEPASIVYIIAIVANLRRHPTATLCGETWRDRQNEPRR